MDDALTAKLRAKARRIYREYEAIYILTNNMTIKKKKQFARSREGIADLKKSELRKFMHRTEKEISAMRRHYGAKAPNTALVTVVEEAERVGLAGSICYLPKHFMDEMFSNYEKVLPLWDRLPQHARMGIDAGFFRDEEGVGQWALLECILFEHMCALFNLAKARFEKLDRRNAPKVEIKTWEALSRATMSTAIYFVESYLNGIAFDFYIKNETKLDEKTKTILTEWDLTRGTPKYLSLRDKAIQLPRIVLGATHPVLQENNCPELEFITGKAKELRDAYVHASPMFNLKTFDPEKEKLLFQVDFVEVERIVDDSVKLAKKIEVAIRGNDNRLFWLYEREVDGRFPDKVFE